MASKKKAESVKCPVCKHTQKEAKVKSKKQAKNTKKKKLSNKPSNVAARARRAALKAAKA
jgi:hypothetical protein